ncbi:phosphatidate cytidylyltransferase [Motilibacter deserti]|uniref:phosphatidate cytidylyltransferase n=1 Tax=Motilibacter deserti TaxID=2714956 RepID=UPI001E5CAAEA|nr:phosphatidate cytidylyltransferase [Motilibacter deserti]
MAANRRRRKAPSKRTPRNLGRNLPVAIAVSLVMGGLLLASLYVQPSIFVGLAAVAALLGVSELVQAFGARGITMPGILLGIAAVATLVAAYAGGEPALLAAFTLSVLGVAAWRGVKGPEGFVRDATAAFFTLAYVPLLTGFALLSLRADDGPDRVVVFVLAVVANDVGGYATGVLFGRHKLAPRVSPGKTWEGLAGSLVVAAAGTAASVAWLLDGPVWAGALLGVACCLTATAGDLAESLIKRDLGIKDMGTLLPGHGGVMDRLDSLLPTAPVAYLLIEYVVLR